MHLTKAGDSVAGCVVVDDNGKSYILLRSDFVLKYEALVEQVKKLDKDVYKLSGDYDKSRGV